MDYSGWLKFKNYVKVSYLNSIFYIYDQYLLERAARCDSKRPVHQKKSLIRFEITFHQRN